MLRLLSLLVLSSSAAFQLPAVRPAASHAAARASSSKMGLFDGLMAGVTKLQAGQYDEEEIQGRLRRQCNCVQARACVRGVPWPRTLALIPSTNVCVCVCVFAAVRTKPCVVYSMSNCPECQKVKDLLTNMGAVHSEIELDEWEDGMAMRAELIGMGYSTIPATFIGGEHVGDAGAVKKLQEQGVLADKLITAGALSAVQRI